MLWQMAELKVRFLIEHSTSTTTDQWDLIHGEIRLGQTQMFATFMYVLMLLDSRMQC